MVKLSAELQEWLEANAGEAYVVWSMREAKALDVSTGSIIRVVSEGVEYVVAESVSISSQASDPKTRKLLFEIKNLTDKESE